MNLRENRSFSMLKNPLFRASIVARNKKAIMADSKNEKPRKIPGKNFYVTAKGYVYFQDGKSCDCREKIKDRPKPIAVGKVGKVNKEQFIPNGNYFRPFPQEAELPRLLPSRPHSPSAPIVSFRESFPTIPFSSAWRMRSHWTGNHQR